MIKIVQGTFGLKDGNVIIPKTTKDEPFSCDEATEKRLVDAGVAEYVEAIEAEAEVEEVAEEMTREELIAAYKDLGLKGNPKTMKTETLKAKIAEAAELVEDEEAPVFNEADGVVQ